MHAANGLIRTAPARRRAGHRSTKLRRLTIVLRRPFTRSQRAYAKSDPVSELCSEDDRHVFIANELFYQRNDLLAPLVGWAKPTGPAFGRPDDRLRVPTLGLSRWARREERAFAYPKPAQYDSNFEIALLEMSQPQLQPGLEQR